VRTILNSPGLYRDGNPRDPDGISNPIDGTWTMASRANQKIASFCVVAFKNPGVAEQDGLMDSYKLTHQLLNEAIVRMRENIQIRRFARFDWSNRLSKIPTRRLLPMLRR
jgi:hypothetical protein